MNHCFNCLQEGTYQPTIIFTLSKDDEVRQLSVVTNQLYCRKHRDEESAERLKQDYNHVIETSKKYNMQIINVELIWTETKTLDPSVKVKKHA